MSEKTILRYCPFNTITKYKAFGIPAEVHVDDLRDFHPHLFPHLGYRVVCSSSCKTKQ